MKIKEKQQVKTFNRKKIEKELQSKKIQAPAEQMSPKEIEAFILKHAD